MNTHTHREHTHGAVGNHFYAAAPGEELGVRCLVQGHFSRGIEVGETFRLRVPLSNPHESDFPTVIRSRCIWYCQITNSVIFLQMLMERSQLPVKNFKEQIMSAINNNPVVIIRGATGCGKTTQVPQYILDEFVQAGRASDCNIIVTQVSCWNSYWFCVLGLHKNKKVILLASAVVYPLSQDGSVLCQCLNVCHSREERRWGKAVATVCVLSLSCPDLMPASSSAQLVC